MEHGFIKVAAVTPKIKVAAPEYNAKEICDRLRDAYEKGAKIIVFPELCITGYTCGDLFLQQSLLDEAMNALDVIRKATKGQDAVVFVGLPVANDGGLYNVAAVLQDGKVLGMVPKTNIPTYAEFYEGRHFTAGKGEVTDRYQNGEKIAFGGNLLFVCSNMPELVIGCEICEDLWVANPPAVNLALRGATVIANLSASNETVGKDEYRQLLVQSASARAICGYIYASAGEGESTQTLVFGGHNLVAENGMILEQSKHFQGETIYADIDLQRLAMERRRMGTFGKESLCRYVVVPFCLQREKTELCRTFAPKPFVPDDETTKRKRCEEILSIQSYGLKKRMEYVGGKSLTLEMRGDTASVLALLVAVRTFDMLGVKRKEIVVVSPTGESAAKGIGADTRKLAELLGVTIKEEDEIPAYAMEPHDMTDFAMGRVMYRGERMPIYGVNVGVPKTLVRHLIAYYADTCERKEVQSILEKYSRISVGFCDLDDFFMYYMLRCGFTASKLYRVAKEAFRGSYEDAAILRELKHFYKSFFGSQLRNCAMPDGPKVGSVAISPGGDLRMPSDACVEIWLRQLDEMERSL